MEKQRNLPINLISVNVLLKPTTIHLVYETINSLSLNSMAIFSLSKDRETFVEQTARAAFSDNASQWSIFDAYNEDYDQQVKKEKF